MATFIVSFAAALFGLERQLHYVIAQILSFTCPLNNENNFKIMSSNIYRDVG